MNTMNTALNEQSWRELHAYWFADIDPSLDYMQGRLPIWFFADAAADAYIRETFVPWIAALEPAMLARWCEAPRSLLAAILLYDQVPRNAFRGQPESFAYDATGLALAELLFERGFDRALEPVERFFAVLPFQHQEEPGMQLRQLEAVHAIADQAAPGHQRFFGVARDMAERHRAAIDRFGRFPHRNVILGRQSSAAELSFLDDPKNHF